MRTRVGRCGRGRSAPGLGGNFAAPPGTPFDQLSLPPDRLSANTIKLNYRILHTLPDDVQMGEIAPGFEQLVELGYLEEIK
ncbi:glycohydrolase toxin TNT-related protein [Microbacterium resistens]|uniref:glycohydrolase toxin TNT-related protein n=1 Tax=Microbacterium resistens TaxID=156977 RepID=UPI0037C9AF1F